MRREVTVDGKRYEVEVADCPIGSPFKVKVNAKILEVLLEHELNQKNFNLRIDKESYLVELPNLLRNMPFSVKVNNIPFEVEIKSSTSRIAVASPHPVLMEIPKSTKTTVEGAVVAPMAGKIVSIKVRKGDQVKMGMILCVLEAMKMENEITAPRSGTVQEILVQAGKAVNEGEALVVLK